MTVLVLVIVETPWKCCRANVWGTCCDEYCALNCG